MIDQYQKKIRYKKSNGVIAIVAMWHNTLEHPLIIFLIFNCHALYHVSKYRSILFSLGIVDYFSDNNSHHRYLPRVNNSAQ